MVITNIGSTITSNVTIPNTIHIIIIITYYYYYNYF